MPNLSVLYALQGLGEGAANLGKRKQDREDRAARQQREAVDAALATLQLKKGGVYKPEPTPPDLWDPAQPGGVRGLRGLELTDLEPREALAAKAARSSPLAGDYRYDPEEDSAVMAGIRAMNEKAQDRALRERQVGATERQVGAAERQAGAAEVRANAAAQQQPTPRSIDRNSPEGVAADVERARRIAEAEVPFKEKLANIERNRPARLPESAVEKMAGIDALVGQANEVVAALGAANKKGVDVTGRFGGLIREPTWLMNTRGKGGDTGKDVRSLISNLFATLAHQRGGTALSASEIQLLESYLPTTAEDEGTAIVKTRRFIKELQRMKATKEQAYERYGYRSGRDDATATSATSDADLYEQRRDAGDTHEQAVQFVQSRRKP